MAERGLQLSEEKTVITHIEDVKRRNGDFVGAFPVYGYMKAEDNKNLLVPDPYASRVVCDIFRMRLEGASASKIAAELNRLGILSPLAYKKNNGLPYAKKGYTHLSWE